MAAAIVPETPVEEVTQIQQLLRRSFRAGKARSISYRKEQLLHLAYLFKDNMQRFRDAIQADLGRSGFETDLLELNPILKDLGHVHARVAKWATPEKAIFTPLWFSSSPAIRKEPKGVVLIISPFNFPILLSISPLIGAIAAGNAAVLKPSELSPNVSSLFAELFPLYLDQELYRVVNGGIPQTSKLLELPWDHILYTGGSRVAKIVSLAAAQHLSPVSLELGGKSPVIVDPKCDLRTTARRILWGRCCNSGQICVSPDYVLVPRHFQSTLVAELKKVYAEFYPTGPRTSDSFSRIISTTHTMRIKGLLDDTKGLIVAGGEVDIDAKYVAPTIVQDVTGEDSLMSEELFGPILPIVPVDDLDEAIEFVNDRPHPLVLYLFSKDSKLKQKVRENTQSGAICINEVLIYVGTIGLPFGGTGASGSGYHTGKFSFDMFTHLRATLDMPSWVDTVVLNRRYPPYTDKAKRILDIANGEWLPARPGASRKSSFNKLWKFFLFLAALAAWWKRKRE